MVIGVIKGMQRAGHDVDLKNITIKVVYDCLNKRIQDNMEAQVLVLIQYKTFLSENKINENTRLSEISELI